MSDRMKVILFLLGDLVSLYLALFLTVYIWLGFKIDQNIFIQHIIPFSFLFSGWILTYFIEGLYTVRTQSPSRMIAYIGRSTGINVLLSFIFFYIFPNFIITPKTNLIVLGGLTFLIMTIWRRWLLKFFSFARFKENIYIISNEKSFNEVSLLLSNKPHLGFNIIKHFTPERLKSIKLDLEALKKEKIGLIVIDRNALKHEETLDRIFKLLSHNIEVMDLSRFIERLSGAIPLNAIEKSWFLEFCGCNQSRFYNIGKSFLDRLIAIIAIIIIVPLYIPLLIILLLISGRPLFFTQTRVGHFNRHFTLFKLRTMVTDAEKDGAKWATPNDSRVTPIGKFLRKTRLDELPQLINVLKGEMSLVGPRPERPEFTQELSKKIPFYNERHLVKPGVTGWAQINFRYGFSEDDSATKLRYDLYYIKNKSIWMDLAIILKTAKAMTTGLGH